PVATNTHGAGPSERSDDPGCVDLPDEVIAIICEIDVALRVHGNTLREPHRGLRGFSAVATVTGATKARDGGDLSVCRGHLADPVVQEVCDINVSTRVQRDVIRIDARLCRRVVV